jgi:nucleoside-triphosphatase THEP1
MDRPALILTGEIGIGKTTACRNAVRNASGRGFHTGGILTPPIFVDGKKTGFYAEDLRTGERWVLGTRDTGAPIEGPVYGIYRFAIDGFKRAYGALKTAVVERCDLIVLDEIGPLEIVHKKGFFRILEPLFNVKDAYLLLVVRPSLVEDVTKMLGERRTELFTVDIQTRDRMPDTLIDQLKQ